MDASSTLEPIRSADPLGDVASPDPFDDALIEAGLSALLGLTPVAARDDQRDLDTNVLAYRALGPQGIAALHVVLPVDVIIGRNVDFTG